MNSSRSDGSLAPMKLMTAWTSTAARPRHAHPNRPHDVSRRGLHALSPRGRLLVPSAGSLARKLSLALVPEKGLPQPAPPPPELTCMAWRARLAPAFNTPDSVGGIRRKIRKKAKAARRQKLQEACEVLESVAKHLVFPLGKAILVELLSPTGQSLPRTGQSVRALAEVLAA